MEKKQQAIFRNYVDRDGCEKRKYLNLLSQSYASFSDRTYV